jgi:hypothetical protein
MKKILVIALVILLAQTIYSQGVAINASGAPASSNAMLDVLSTNKGVMIPRMTSAQRKAIPVTANDNGLLVFDKERQRLYMYDGNKWIPFAMEVNNVITGQGSTVNPNYESTPQYAYATAVDGQYAVIGCPRDSLNGISNVGTARVFQNVNGNWTQIAELHPNVPYPHCDFGRAVAISGDYIVVGAPTQQVNIPNTNSFADAGAVYIFHRTGNSWPLQQKVYDIAPAIDERFGISVDISGTTIVVGAPGTANIATPEPGSVFLYNLVNNTWQLTIELMATSGTPDAEFGNCVSMYGNIIACGAPYADNTALGIQNCGAVYIFTSARGGWEEDQKIYSHTPTANGWFGDQVSVYGSKLLATNYFNACEMFTNSMLGWVYQEDFHHPLGAGTNFAERILIHNSYMFISAVEENVNGIIYAGATYVYKKNIDGKYLFLKRLTDSDPFFYNSFGTGIGFDGYTLIVGSPGRLDHPMRGNVNFFGIGD